MIIPNIFTALTGTPLWLFALTFSALLQLGVMFGITWRYGQWVQGRIEAWRRQPLLAQILLAPLVLLAGALSLGFLINDWLTNAIFLTLWFAVISRGRHVWPEKVFELVTQRTQRYLDAWAVDPSEFNRLEVATLRFIVWFATRFDPQHFDVPAGFFPVRTR